MAVRRIVIENGVTYIGNYAFSNFRNLTEVSIADSVTGIGERAFLSCFNLQRLVLPDSVTQIDWYAFDNCNDLTLYGSSSSYARSFANNRCIPFVSEQSSGSCGGDCHWSLYENGLLMISGGSQIGGYPLWNTDMVTEVIIENSVTRIDSYAFANCRQLSSISIPDSLCYIGYHAFENCCRLKTISLPDSVGYISPDAFIGCGDLTIICNRYSYAESFANDYGFKAVVAVGRGASGDCTWLFDNKGVLTVFGTGEMMGYPQWDRSLVTKAVIENGVSGIGENAFADCYNLRSITIPNSVGYINSGAFNGCSNHTITCDQGSGAEAFAHNNSFNVVVVIGRGASGDCAWVLDDKGVLTVSGAGVMSGYPQWNQTAVTKVVIENGVSEISYNAFAECHHIKSIVIPNSVTFIESGAFNSCMGLTIICEQGSYAATFANNYGFKAVIVVDSGTSGDCTWALDSNGGLTVSGGGVMSGYPQWNRTAVTKAVIEDGVSGIGYNVFADCHNMKSITIPNSVTAIDFGAFNGCCDLTIICEQGSYAETFARNSGFNVVVVIGRGTFGSCEWVLDDTGVLTISGAGEIMGYPEWNRLAVTKAVIEYGISRIGCNAFADCTNMSSVKLPESVGNIDSRAFHNCSALTSIAIPSSVSYISADAFEGCDALTTIYGFENSCVPSFAGNRFKPILDTCLGCGLYLTEDNLVDLPECPATCTADGYCNKSVCPDCGEAYEFTRIPALGHRTVTDRAVAPTCTKSGLTEGSHCGRCDEVIKAQRIIPATGHQSVVDPAVAATCTRSGLTEGSHCSVCGVIIVSRTTVPALGHLEEIDPAIPPTCTESGLTEGSHCSRCSETLLSQEVIPATGHTETVDEHGYAPTCTEDGLTDRILCETCGALLHDHEVISALGHTVVIDEEILPSCVIFGRTAGAHCGVCGEVLQAQEIIPMGGHHYIKVEGSHADCTHSGKTMGAVCDLCGDVLFEQEDIPAAGHLEITDPGKPATCTEAGLTEGKHCAVCGEITVPQEVIPATGHTVVTDAAVEPSCLSSGLTEGAHCSVCHAVIMEQQVIDAAGHDLAIIEPTPADCSHEGQSCGVKCIRCGETLIAPTIVSDSHNHHYEIVEGTPATDDEDGMTSGVRCSDCGEWLLAQEVIPHRVVYYLGDANTDQRIDIADVTAIQTYLTELNELNTGQCALADVNRDGAVDIADATLIQMYAAEMIDHF